MARHARLRPGRARQPSVARKALPIPRPGRLSRAREGSAARCRRRHAGTCSSSASGHLPAAGHAQSCSEILDDFLRLLPVTTPTMSWSRAHLKVFERASRELMPARRSTIRSPPSPGWARGHVAHSSLQEGGSSSSTRPIASTAAAPASSSTYGAARRAQRRNTSACPRRASRLPPRIPRRRRSHCLGHREAAPSGARSGGARYTSRIVGGRRHARVATGTSRSPRAASSAWHRREWWRRARDSR